MILSYVILLLTIPQEILHYCVSNVQFDAKHSISKRESACPEMYCNKEHALQGKSHLCIPFLGIVRS
jgi:hypothetical protein